MRISLRTALSALVLSCVVLSAGTVHLSWRRTADANSRSLANALHRQITSAVRAEVATRIADAEAAFHAVRTIFVQNVIETRQADKREFVFLSQLQAQPALSWIAFGWPDGAFFASHKLGDERLEMMEIMAAPAPRNRRVDRYKVFSDDIEFEDRSFEPTSYDVQPQPWYEAAAQADAPSWHWITDHPGRKQGAITFAGPIDVYHQRQGVLAVMIELSRLSRFLSGLEVGRRGAAFILASDGHIVAGPDPLADEANAVDVRRFPLLGVARQAGERIMAAGEVFKDNVEWTLSDGGSSYAVSVTPLGFRDWSVAVAIPEDEFLGPVRRTTSQLTLVLSAFLVIGAIGSLAAASILIGRPLRAITGDLERARDFNIDEIMYRPSHLRELDTLSAALKRMAAGLTAFGRYLPRDLVRVLVEEEVEAKPGGSARPLTVMFADVAGFTGLSERLRDGIVPLIGAYFEAVSGVVEEHGGTIDKFIGDAVMAFWGAPRPDEEHAVHACRAALSCLTAIRRSGLVDDRGAPLKVRIGVNSGVALVGNIGSQARLNYTAIGDAVNIASRLEGLNKVYGTEIIVGEETRRQVGARIVARELDKLAVQGRLGRIKVFELVAMAESDAPVPDWIGAYESALSHYCRQHWSEAAAGFASVIALRGADRPSEIMIERCRMRAPPAAHEPAAAMETSC
jgi:adenylate cyclase